MSGRRRAKYRQATDTLNLDESVSRSALPTQQVAHGRHLGAEDRKGSEGHNFELLLPARRVTPLHSYHHSTRLNFHNPQHMGPGWHVQGVLCYLPDHNEVTQGKGNLWSVPATSTD